MSHGCHTAHMRTQVKRAIEKGNIDGAKIYAQNAIRKKTEALNYLRLASRLDAVVSRLDTQAKMNMINSSMSQVPVALLRTQATTHPACPACTRSATAGSLCPARRRACSTRRMICSQQAGSTPSLLAQGIVQLRQRVCLSVGLSVHAQRAEGSKPAAQAKRALRAVLL